MIGDYQNGKGGNSAELAGNRAEKPALRYSRMFLSEEEANDFAGRAREGCKQASR